MRRRRVVGEMTRLEERIELDPFLGSGSTIIAAERTGALPRRRVRSALRGCDHPPLRGRDGAGSGPRSNGRDICRTSGTPAGRVIGGLQAHLIGIRNSIGAIASSIPISSTSQSPRIGMRTKGLKEPDCSAGWREAVQSPRPIRRSPWPIELSSRPKSLAANFRFPGCYAPGACRDEEFSRK